MRLNQIECYIVIFVILNISACKNNNRQDNIKSIDLSVFFNRDIKLNLSDYFENITYIIPEFRSDAIPGNYQKVKIINNKVLILDNFDRLFIYENNGKFCGIITKKGRGPGEYKQIVDFILIKNKIFVLDNAERIVVYNLQGEFISEKKLDAYYVGLADFYGQLMAYTIPPWTKENSDYKITLFDENLSVDRKAYLKQWEDNFGNNLLHTFISLYMFDGVFSILESGVDTIYRCYRNLNRVPVAAFNFKKLNLNEHKSNSIILVPPMLFTFFETPGFYFTRCVFNKRSYCLFIDKSDLKGGNVVFNYDIIDNGFHNDIDGGYPFWPEGISDKGELFTWFDIMAFRERKYLKNEEYFLSLNVKNTEKADAFKKMLESAGEKTNPVIMLCTLKNH